MLSVCRFCLDVDVDEHEHEDEHETSCPSLGHGTILQIGRPGFLNLFFFRCQITKYFVPTTQRSN